MGVCKQIATRRLWDPNLIGRDPESVAMRQHARKFKGPVIEEDESADTLGLFKDDDPPGGV